MLPKKQNKQKQKYNSKDCKKKSIGIRLNWNLHTYTNCYILWISLLIIQQYIHFIVHQNQ